MNKIRLITHEDLQDNRRGDLIDIAETVAERKGLEIDFNNYNYDDLVAFIVESECYFVEEL